MSQCKSNQPTKLPIYLSAFDSTVWPTILTHKIKTHAEQEQAEDNYTTLSLSISPPYQSFFLSFYLQGVQLILDFVSASRWLSVSV